MLRAATRRPRTRTVRAAHAREAQFSDLEFVRTAKRTEILSAWGHLMVEPVSLAAAPTRVWRVASRHPDGVA